MSAAKPLLTGGAAAVILAGAATLFPPFATVDRAASAEQSEFARAQASFAQMLGTAGANATKLAEFGLASGALPGAEDAVLLREQAGSCAGQGIYWIRDKGERKLAITAPHRGSDRHTGTLASALFLETNAQAAAWNSAPRRPTKTCEIGIDLAREENHLFTAFALGFAQASPAGLMVQLHGFDGERRRSIAAQNAAMIISNGTEQPNDRVFDLADCLSLAFAPASVLAYPGDTGELGGVSNAQGKALREANFDGFIHMEIAADLRAALVADGNLRAKLATCLVEAS